MPSLSIVIKYNLVYKIIIIGDSCIYINFYYTILGN